MADQPLFPVLETNQLQLRELCPEDRDDLFAIFSQEQVVEHYGIPPFKSVKKADSFLKSRIKRFHAGNGVAWGITLLGTERLIGSCQFKSWEKRTNCSEIAYELHPDHWNQGLMTEAVGAMIHYGFATVKLNRIEAWTSANNGASRKVLEKSGFQFEGVQRDKAFWHGQYHDIAWYSFLKSGY